MVCRKRASLCRAPVTTRYCDVVPSLISCSDWLIFPIRRYNQNNHRYDKRKTLITKKSSLSYSWKTFTLNINFPLKISDQLSAVFPSQRRSVLRAMCPLPLLLANPFNNVLDFRSYTRKKHATMFLPIT